MVHTFFMPGEILSGENVITEGVRRIPKELKRILIITSSCNIELGFIEPFAGEITKAGKEYVLCGIVDSEPTDKIVEEGTLLYKSNQCDCILAVGGGSVLDVMKAVALMASNPGKISDYTDQTAAIRKTPFMAAVPTTAGTGSEATQFTVITDTENDRKMLIGNKELMPDLVLLLPELTMTAPLSVTVSTGMDALIHAVEAFVSKKAQPLTDNFALSAIRRIFEYLPRVYMEGSDREARTQMAYAALEAGIAFNNSSVTLIHGMSRPIGALFHVPHGLSNAMLAEVCLPFMADSSYERFARLALEIHVGNKENTDKENAGLFVEALAGLCRKCRIPSLKEYGIEKEEFLGKAGKMAEDAVMSRSPQNLRKEVTKEDILRLYSELWKEEDGNG